MISLREFIMFAKREDVRDDDLRTVIWDPYNQKKIGGFTRVANQTELFFKAIPTEENNEFHAATTGVIQLGISTANYLTRYCSLSTRCIFGYDYSPVAIDHVSKKGVSGRLVNLNRINRNNDKQLDYHDVLKADLAASRAVLIIRTLEYLNPEAVKLLIFTLLDLSKPDTKFYLEIFTVNCKDTVKESSMREFHHNLEPGYIPSFFAPRTDIKFLSHSVSNDEHSEDDAIVERVILQKLV